MPEPDQQAPPARLFLEQPGVARNTDADASSSSSAAPPAMMGRRRRRHDLDLGIEPVELAHPTQGAEELGPQLRAGAEGDEDVARDQRGGGVEGGGFGEGEEGLDVGVGVLEVFVLDVGRWQDLGGGGSVWKTFFVLTGQERRRGKVWPEGSGEWVVGS